MPPQARILVGVLFAASICFAALVVAGVPLWLSAATVLGSLVFIAVALAAVELLSPVLSALGGDTRKE